MQNDTEQVKNAEVFETKPWRIFADIIAALSALGVCALGETEIKISLSSLPNNKQVLDGQQRQSSCGNKKPAKENFQ